MNEVSFYEWLKSQGVKRCSLIEVDTVSPKFLSTVPYTTTPTDPSPNLPYLPVVDSSFAFSEKLSLDGNPSISVGDIEIENNDGRLDSWLDEVWVNTKIRIYIGDVSWKREDFFLIFDGVVANLDSRSRGKLNISLRSKLDRLNTPVTESLLGGSTSNSDRILPLTFGECHNITPLLVDPPNHVYQFHQGSAERVIEVRDNGVPITVNTSLSQGKFTLVASPAGTITASVQGKTPYTNTVAGIIKFLATQYGTPTERFSLSEIDEDNFNAFNTLHPQPVGVYLGDRANVLAVCQELAASVGAQLVVSNLGKLRLIKIETPSATGAYKIGLDNYEYNSLSISSRSEVIAGVRLGYCKNWTIQETLDTGIPAANKDMFAQEWLTVSSRDSSVASQYKLYADPPQIDTLLLKHTHAQAEATRRLGIWKVPHNIFRLRGFPELLQLKLGQSVILEGTRWGLDSGKLGQVVGLESDWIAGRVDVEVMI